MAANRFSTDHFGIGALGLLLILGLSACLRDEPSPLGVNGRGSIAGTLMGTDLLPIPDADVALAIDGSELSNTRTDSSGRFGFGDLRAGAYEVRVVLPLGFDTTAQAALLGIEGGRVVVRAFVSSGEAPITVQLRPVRRVTVTVPPGGAEAIVTASGAIVEVVPLGGDVPITVSLAESTSVALSALSGATHPVRVTITGGTSGALVRPPSNAGAVQASARIRLTQAVTVSTHSYLYVFNGGTEAEPLLMFADARIGSYVDPRTGKSYTVAFHEFDIVPGQSVDAVAAVARADQGCPDSYRSLYAVDGPNTPDPNRIPLILIHGWEKWKEKCDDFVDYTPETEHIEPIVASLRRDSEVARSYQIFVLKYPTNDHVFAAARFLRQEIDRLGLQRPVVVGYSMGGLVGRAMMAGATVSSVRGLITLGTPHEGSRLADLVQLGNLSISEWLRIHTSCGVTRSTIVSLFAIGASAIPNTNGANDLRPSSDLITALKGNTWPSGGVVTIAGELSDWSTVSDPFYSLFGCILQELTPGSNDGAVPVSSAVPEWTTLQAVFSGRDHLDLTKNDEVASRLLTALKAMSGSCEPGANWEQEPIDEIAGAEILSVWIGDANNDQQNEVLVTTTNGLLLQYQYTGTEWAPTTIVSYPGRSVFVRDVGDADNDGKREVLVDFRIEPVFSNQSAELRLYEYANGSWPYQTITQGAAGSYEARIGDADGNGANDIVVTGYNLSSILLFKFGSGGYEQSQIDNIPESSQPRAAVLAIGDAMNLNTKQVYVGTHTSGNIYAYRWNGVAWIKTIVEEGTGYVAYPFVGDVDNSGRNSLLVSKYGGLWGLRQYTHTGSAWSNTLVEPAERLMVALADINADGGNEIVSVWGNTVYAYTGRGDGTWSSRIVTTIDFEAYYTLAVGDALNNGCPSMVIGERYGGRVVLLRRN